MQTNNEYKTYEIYPNHTHIGAFTLVACEGYSDDPTDDSIYLIDREGRIVAADHVDFGWTVAGKPVERVVEAKEPKALPLSYRQINAAR